MTAMSIVTVTYRDAADGYWLDWFLDDKLQDSICFDSAHERKRARDDFMAMSLQAGGQELPLDPRKLS